MGHRLPWPDPGLAGPPLDRVVARVGFRTSAGGLAVRYATADQLFRPIRRARQCRLDATLHVGAPLPRTSGSVPDAGHRSGSGPPDADGSESPVADCGTNWPSDPGDSRGRHRRLTSTGRRRRRWSSQAASGWHRVAPASAGARAACRIRADRGHRRPVGPAEGASSAAGGARSSWATADDQRRLVSSRSWSRRAITLRTVTLGTDGRAAVRPATRSSSRADGSVDAGGSIPRRRANVGAPFAHHSRLA